MMISWFVVECECVYEIHLRKIHFPQYFFPSVSCGRMMIDCSLTHEKTAIVLIVRCYFYTNVTIVYNFTSLIAFVHDLQSKEAIVVLDKIVTIFFNCKLAMPLLARSLNFQCNEKCASSQGGFCWWWESQVSRFLCETHLSVKLQISSLLCVLSKSQQFPQSVYIVA